MTLRRCLCSNCSFPFSFCSFNCIMTNLCKGRLVKGMHVLGTCGCNNLPYNFTGCVPNDISSSPLKTQGHNNTRLVARSFLSYILWLENYHMMGLDMNKKHCKITFHVSWCLLKFKILLIFVVLNMTRCFSDLAVMDKAIWEEMELFRFPTFPCLLTHKEWINMWVSY